MSDEQFQTVSNWLMAGHRAPTHEQVTAIMRMLDEVERLRDKLDFTRNTVEVWRDEYAVLRAENAAMRPIVEAVASPLDVVREHVCRCDGPYDGPHEPHCIVAKARAFLASEAQ